MTSELLEAPKTQLFTVKQFCQRHAWATEGGLRHLIFNGDTNGFAPCIKRVGRRILLDEIRVFEWIDENNQQPATSE